MTRPDPDSPAFGPAILLGVILAILVTLLVIDRPKEPDPIAPPVGTESAVPAQVEVEPALEIAPAVVTTPAIRSQAVQITDTVPPPPKPKLSARDTCNGLTWKHLDPTASDACFRAIATERGWKQSNIDAWVYFVAHSNCNIIICESEYCWNLRGGGRVVAGSNCVIRVQGSKEDTGLGQVTSVWWNDRGYLCTKHGYCGWRSIIASPYDSMLASVILPIEMTRPNGGSDPWCFRTPWDAYSYHNCWNAPDR